MWIIHNLVDTIAKGGNFMVGIGPDGNGKFHLGAIRELEEAGKWVDIHKEGIFGTRMWIKWKGGNDDELRYTCTKDGNTLFIFALAVPEKNMIREKIVPKPDSEIILLESGEKIPWQMEGEECCITLPHPMTETRPWYWTWCLKVELS